MIDTIKKFYKQLRRDSIRNYTDYQFSIATMYLILLGRKSLWKEKVLMENPEKISKYTYSQ